MITACPPRAGVSRRYPIIPPPPVKLSVLYPTASVGYAPASNHWRACHTVPEGIASVLPLGLCVGHDVRHQLDDVIVRADIVEGIVPVRLVRIDQVEGDHPVSMELQDPAQSMKQL